MFLFRDFIRKHCGRDAKQKEIAMTHVAEGGSAAINVVYLALMRVIQNFPD
jgi:hypothetical protein